MVEAIQRLVAARRQQSPLPGYRLDPGGDHVAGVQGLGSPNNGRTGYIRGAAHRGGGTTGGAAVPIAASRWLEIREQESLGM